MEVPENPEEKTRVWAAATARLGGIGADPTDDEDLRERRRLLVLLAVLTLPVSVVWGALYLAFDSPLGILPFVYFTVSVGSLVVFARTRNCRPLLFVQLANVLLLTTTGAMLSGGVPSVRRGRPVGHPRAPRSARLPRGA